MNYFENSNQIDQLWQEVEWQNESIAQIRKILNENESGLLIVFILFLSGSYNARTVCSYTLYLVLDSYKCSLSIYVVLFNLISWKDRCPKNAFDITYNILVFWFFHKDQL